MIKVLTFRSPEDLRWSFESEGCSFNVPSGTYTRVVKVDPFPGYSHEIASVEVETRRASAAFPIPQDVTISVLDREPIERTNGWCNCNYHWSGKEETPRKWSASIVLAGKRIPPHPAMTRYLVSHEYGHAVQQYISWKRDDRDSAARAVYEEYQKLRGFTTQKHYGGGTWHACVEELFANDFRILVVGAEVEFWPHPGFPRPEGVPAIIDFWKKAQADAIAAASELALAT